MDMLWICYGYVMDMLWISYEYVVDMIISTIEGAIKTKKTYN